VSKSETIKVVVMGAGASYSRQLPNQLFSIDFFTHLLIVAVMQAGWASQR
jgi:hypothetical protein